MKKITIIFILVLTLVSMSGCATYCTRFINEPFKDDNCKIYVSTYFNCSFIGYFGMCEKAMITDSTSVNAFEEALIILLGCPSIILGNTIDLPISIVSDTLFLPLDVYRWNFPKKLDDTKQNQNQEELKDEKQEKN